MSGMARNGKITRHHHAADRPKIKMERNGNSGIAQSVERLATGCTVRRSIVGRGEIFRTLPDRAWGPPSLQYSGYRVFFPGVKRQSVALTTHAHPAPRLKKEKSYTSIPPLDLHGTSINSTRRQDWKFLTHYNRNTKNAIYRICVWAANRLDITPCRFKYFSEELAASILRVQEVKK